MLKLFTQRYYSPQPPFLSLYRLPLVGKMLSLKYACVLWPHDVNNGNSISLSFNQSLPKFTMRNELPQGSINFPSAIVYSVVSPINLIFLLSLSISAENDKRVRSSQKFNEQY